MDSKQYKVGILGSGRMGGTVAMPYAGNDLKGKEIVAQLITDSGFDPFDAGDAANGKLLDLPMGEGSLYGEERHLDTLKQKVNQLMRENA